MADRYPTLEELYRRGPVTPLGGSATLAGPSQAVEQAAQERPHPNMTEGARDLRTAGEIAATVAAPIAMGGPLGAGVAAAGIASRFITPVANALIRGGVAGLAGLGTSEAMTPEGTETPAEANSRRMLAIGEGMGGELISPGPTRGIQAAKNIGGRLDKRAQQELAPLAVEAQELLREHGGSMTIGQGREGFVLDTLENILEASFSGGQVIKRARGKGENAALEALEAAMPNVARYLDTDAAGELVAQAIKDASVISRRFTKAQYQSLDNTIALAGGGDVVDLSQVLATMQKRLETSAATGDRKALGIIGLLEKFSQGPVSFQQADKIRSTLLSMSRATNDIVPDVRAVAGSAAELVDNQMAVAGLRLGTLGMDVLDAFKAARAASKTHHDVFGDRLIGELLGKAAPERLARALYEADSPSRIAAVRKIIMEPRYRSAVGNPSEFWANIQGSFLMNLRSKAGEGPIGELNGKALRIALEKSRGTFRELFPDPVQRAQVTKAARALELVQGRAGSSRSGGVMIQLTQPNAYIQAGKAVAEGSIWGAAYLGVVGEPGFQWSEDGVIILGPAVLSRLMTRPRFVSFMLDRANTRADRAGRVSGRVMAQLIARVREEGVPFAYQSSSGEVMEFEGGSQYQPNTLKPTSKLQPQ